MKATVITTTIKRKVILNVEMTEHEADLLFSLLDCHVILKRAKSLRVNFSPIEIARSHAAVCASSRAKWGLK